MNGVNKINLQHLSAFEAINNAEGTEIVQFKEGVYGKELASGGSYTGGRLIGRLIRYDETKARNNEVRQALLTALCRTFDLGREERGVYRMPDDVVARLQTILGKGVLCAKSGNEFELNSKGKVCSGSPLTERRITQILNKVHELASRETIQPDESNYTPSHLSRGGTTLANAIATTEQNKMQILKDNFTVGSIGAETDIIVEFNEALKNCRAFPSSDDRTQEIDSSFKYARDVLRAGLNDVPTNYKQFFTGIMLYNEVLKSVNMGIADTDRHYKFLDPADFLGKLSPLIQVSQHPENYPAEPIEPKQPQIKLAVENFVVVGKALGPITSTKPAPLAMATQKALSFAMENGRQDQPDASDIIRGLVSVKGKQDEVRQALADAIATMFKPVNGTFLLEGEKERILQAVTNTLKDPQFKGGPSEKQLITVLCGKFDALKLRGSMELDETHASMALERAINVLRESWSNSEATKNLLSRTGGGFKNAESFTFEADLGGGKKVELTSSFTPAPSEVNKGDENKGAFPLSNLGVSTLKREGSDKPIVSFVRFGQVSVNEALRDKKKNKDDRKEVRKAAFMDIARQMIAANPELLRKGMNPDGSIKLPIYRVNMCGSNECALRDIESVEIEQEVDGVKRKVKAEIHDVFVPLDSSETDKNTGEKIAVLSVEHQKKSVSGLNALLQDAEAKKEQLGEAEKAKVEKLVKSLTSYRDNVLQPLIDTNTPMDNADGKRGPEMLRFGSQLALLASLLGHMPAINCNWGRDRTSAMDSEIKRLAFKFEQGDVTEDDLKIKDSTLDDKAERTEFLIKTGNSQMAKRMDCSTHSINLNQSRGTSGFSTMFANTDDL